MLVNPRSGKGRGLAAAHEIVGALRASGRLVRTVHIPYDEPLEDPLRQCSLAIIVGGDGTLHHSLGALSATRTPTYHVAMGTENLFARQFRMRRDPRSLLEAIRRAHVRDIDLGECNGRLFALMLGIGFDACIVDALDRSRGDRIRRSSYLRPMVRTARWWRAPTFEVSAEGRPVLAGESGMVVIANSPHYGGRLNPATRASVFDGMLDLVYFPCRSAVGLVVPGLVAPTGLHLRSGLAKGFRARGFEVLASGEGAKLQLDGERVEGAGEIRVSVRAVPRALRVLVPKEARA